MRSFLCVSAYALVAVGLCVAAAVPANAGGCNKLIGTADGWDKPDALSGAQSALAEAVAEFKKGKGAVTSQRHEGKAAALLAGLSLGGALLSSPTS